MKAGILLYLAMGMNVSFCSVVVLADSAGGFNGKGSREAYNKSCAPGNKAVEVAKKGDFQEAIRLDREAISIYPLEPAWHHNLGNHLEKLGKLEEAKKAQEKALELEPNLLAAWLALGLEYEQQKNFKEAERCYRKSVQLSPNDYGAVGSLGDILRQQRKFDEARTWLQRAILCPGSSIAPGEAQRKLDQCNRKDSSP